MIATYCKHEGESSLVKTQISDGSWQVRLLCLDCFDVHDNPVSQEGLDLEDLAMFEMQGFSNPPCRRCGARFTQRHHYMPQALARKAGVDCEDWGTDYLCDDCHMKWHEIVTPGLVKRKPRKWEAPKP